MKKIDPRGNIMHPSRGEKGKEMLALDGTRRGRSHMPCVPRR